ncbi:MAG: hypothetical protein PHU10_05090 [Bacilli bacterium]|nr:hypothetical protein [Bacilli bacterium]
MKKNVKKVWLVLTAVIAVGAGSLGAIDLSGFNGSDLGVGAVTTQTNSRIYVYLKGAWDNPGHMFIHYWGGSKGTTWGSLPEMTNVVGNYWEGLFYYDVPLDHTTFMVCAYAGDTDDKNKSVDISISNLFLSGDYKVAAVSAFIGDGVKRTVENADDAPGSSTQVASVLNHIDSCSSSYASGYNAWPQLNDLFISPSTLDGATVVEDNFGDSTTITNKIAWLQAKYNEDQALPVLFFNKQDSSAYSVTIIGFIGLSLISLLYLSSKKKVA